MVAVCDISISSAVCLLPRCHQRKGMVVFVQRLPSAELLDAMPTQTTQSLTGMAKSAGRLQYRSTQRSTYRAYWGGLRTGTTVTGIYGKGHCYHRTWNLTSNISI